MDDEASIDWRVYYYARLAEDLPAAYPGGPSFKKGAYAFMSTGTNDDERGKVHFTTPSTCALAFNIAFNFAKQAKDLQSQLKTLEVISPNGMVNSIKSKDIPILYDFFELYMICATFCFQAIEAFVNHEIDANVREPMTLKIRKNKKVTYDSEDIERKLSTEEKLDQVLPSIFGISTPKGKKPWEGFKKLKKIRDEIIHIKGRSSRQKSLEENIFIDFIFDDPENLPLISFEIITWFFRGKEMPIWMGKLYKDRVV